MSRTYRMIFIAALMFLAACSGPPESLASTDAEDQMTEEVTDDETTATEASEESVAASEPAEVISSAASVIPQPVESTVSPTTAAPATTAPATTVATTCVGDRHEAVIPAGWAHQDCDVFTSGAFPAAGAPIEFRPEIDFAFTTNETYEQSLARINDSEVVLSSTATLIDGLAAHEFVLADTGWFMDGERRVVVVDAGDGVFFASVNQVIDIQGPLNGGDLDSHYIYSSGIFEQMVSSISIDEVSVCQAPSLTNSVELFTGSADVDSDGVVETIALMRSDEGDYLTVDSDAGDTIWGFVEKHFAGLAYVGWSDWDVDGTPEFFTPGDGGASGVRENVYTIDACAIVPVVHSDGTPASLWNRASGLSANNYRCNFDAQGVLTSFETIDTTIDAVDGTPTSEVTSYIYSAGALTETDAATGTQAATTTSGFFGGCATELS